MAGRRISGWGLAYGVCALFWVPHTAHAKDIPQPATTAGATIAAARKVLEEHYLFPDIAAKLDRELNQAASAGAFQGLTGDALATQVNAEMRKVTRDGHLRLTYQPRLAALLSSQPNVAPQGSGWIEALARQVRETNAGVSKLELLPGNIRYLSYDSFEWGTPAAAEAMATAMQFLRDGDAIIIDLRNNAGGSAEAEAALVSYFVPPGTKLVRFEMRGGADGKPSVSSAAPFSLAGKPTYVLIGPATVSAAEGFAAHAASLHFGTLVGENTGGASYTMRLFPLPGGFTLSVSIGRSINAVTGTDWEGVGIAPSITISDERALAAAEAAAMEKIFLQMGDAERLKRPGFSGGSYL